MTPLHSFGCSPYPLLLSTTAGFKISTSRPLLTCIALRSSTSMVSGKAMQLRHDTFALVGMFSIFLASIHMNVVSHLLTFDFWATCVTLRSSASVIAGMETQSQHDTFALLGMLSLSNAITYKAARVQCSPCDLFTTCIALRSCIAMAVSADVLGTCVALRSYTSTSGVPTLLAFSAVVDVNFLALMCFLCRKSWDLNRRFVVHTPSSSWFLVF